MSVKDELLLIQGTPVQLGRKVYVCPALNIKMLKMFKSELDLINGGMKATGDKEKDQETLEAFYTATTRVLTAALSRNYPDITEEMVEEGIDLNNMKTITLGLLGQSGFCVTTQENAEKAFSGESTGTV